MVTYGTSLIPSDQITVLSGGTVAVSVAFEATLGLIGGMDTANGSATTGEVVEVSDPTSAANLFGEGSELHEQIQLAYQNGAPTTVFALPVEETSVTAEAQTAQDGTLENAPIFDPRVNDEHSITVTDSGGGTLDVNYVDEPPTSAPTETDTVDIYPPTGQYYADATPDGAEYEFDYSYGDYSTAELSKIVDESPRIVTPLTENESVLNDAVTEVNSRATNFDFMQVVGGGKITIDPSSFTNSIDERRLSIAYPSRGYTDTAATNEQRTLGAIGGYLATLPLGISSTNDSIGGFASLKNPLAGPNDAGQLIDERIMPLLDYPPVTIVKDMTTSSDPKFERVYAMNIVDEVTEASHIIAREYVGEPKTNTEVNNLRRSHQNVYNGLVNGTPQLLDDYTVNTVEPDGEPNTVDVNIGIEVVKVIDTIDVTITVGDIIRNGGAN